MAKNKKFKMIAASTLNFTKSGIFSYSNPCMVKFDEHIFIDDRDVAKNKIQDGGSWRPPPS